MSKFQIKKPEAKKEILKHESPPSWPLSEEENSRGKNALAWPKMIAHNKEWINVFSSEKEKSIDSSQTRFWTWKLIYKQL